MAPQPVEVVVAADVLVGAFSRIAAAAVQFPTMPPKTADPYADVIGAFVAGTPDFALILSDEIVEQFVTALVDPARLAWSFDAADQAVDVLVGIAGGCSGGFVTPAFDVHVPPLSATGEVGLRTAASKDLAFPRALVTVDQDATRLQIWRPPSVAWPPDEAVAVLSPTAFRDLVERARWRLRRS